MVICSSERNGAGASSTSFWCRRWSEQSRVETTTTLPCWSARHWVSTWRGLSRYFSTKHSPRPNAETASRTADSNSSVTSSIFRATFSPRPPPPNAALIAIGRPCSLANATTSSASVDRVLRARHEGSADLLRDVARLHLVAEVLDRLRGRADPHQAGVDHRLREVAVLGEEAVAGVHRVGAGLLRDRDDLADVEVGVARCRAVERVRLVGEPHEERVPVRLGVDGDTADAGVPAGADHPDGDLPAVGDQDLLQRCGLRHRATVSPPFSRPGWPPG